MLLKITLYLILAFLLRKICPQNISHKVTHTPTYHIKILEQSSKCIVRIIGGGGRYDGITCFTVPEMLDQSFITSPQTEEAVWVDVMTLPLQA